MSHHKHPAIITILLLTSQLASSATTKQNARPVYEVINEQARVDDKPKVSNNQGILPYGNPLAGNSIQNARIHASNQQAMFNAERIRQHKAQLQRWMKGPQIIDSYMKAYHDLQENHQLELEEQQATLKDSPVTQATPPPTRGRPIRQRGQNKRVQTNAENSDQSVQNEPSNTSNRVQNKRKDIPRRGSPIQRTEPMKITKADAVIKNIRSRNHRSYGSADYHQYLEPKRYKTVYVSGPSYSQGVYIKPHGNIGLNDLQTKDESKLYTQAIPSEPTPTYPKQYGIQKFNSVQEIEALNSLLTKNPAEQLSELNALVGSEKGKDEVTKEIPIDFYFYLKNPALTAPQSVDPTKYASAYIPSPIKDYTPITEEVDDIQDPTKSKRPITFSQPIPTTATKLETVTTKSNNYYKVEVASQVVSDDTTASQVNYLKDDRETYPSLNYGYQPYYKEAGGDTSEIYLHHNAQPTGVQHLAEDGTETSAYGDDNVSILEIASKNCNKIRSKRSKLETEPFLLPNEKTSTEPITTNSTDAPTSEALIRRNPFNKKRGSDFNVFLAPDFQIGEATDYDYDYEPIKHKKPSKKYESSYEDDYDSYDDFSSPDYDFGSSNLNSYQTYAPSAGYHQLQSKGFSNKFGQYHPVPNLSSLSQIHSSPPATSYGVPFYGSPHIFSTSQNYMPPKIEYPTVSTLGSFHNLIEPVYMLTQTQLKELIGHHNLNIEHLDVYQLAKENKAKKAFHRPRKYRKRNPFRHVKSNLVKIHKFNF